jgi:hypothetical protein
MDIGLHVILPTLAGKWAGITKKYLIAIGIGGATPDLVSGLEHVLFWSGIWEHKWLLRSYAHFTYSPDAWAILLLLAPLFLLIPRWLGLAFYIGYALHFFMDYLWHDPLGGWYTWATITNYSIWGLLVIYYVYRLRKE